MSKSLKKDLNKRRWGWGWEGGEPGFGSMTDSYCASSLGDLGRTLTLFLLFASWGIHGDEGK